MASLLTALRRRQPWGKYFRDMSICIDDLCRRFDQRYAALPHVVAAPSTDAKPTRDRRIHFSNSRLLERSASQSYCN